MNDVERSSRWRAGRAVYARNFGVDETTAERLMTELAQTEGEIVGAPALHYINRLSDFLFVASRFLNARAGGDVLWVPGQNR